MSWGHSHRADIRNVRSAALTVLLVATGLSDRPTVSEKSNEIPGIPNLLSVG